MKKLFTSAFLAAAVFLTTAQTTWYSKDFQGGMSPWTTVDKTGTGAGVWQYKTGALSVPSLGSVTFSSASATTGYVYFLSDAANDDNKPEDADLISPAVNCSSLGYVFLEFNEYFRQYGSSIGTVYVSDNGSSWIPVYSVDETSNNPHHVEIDITSFAAGKSTVYLKFNFQGDYDYFWMVDDVKLTIPVALDIAVDEITMNKYVGLGNQTVSGKVINKGGTYITSFDLFYTDNGGSPVTQSYNGVNLAPLQTLPFSFTQPMNINTAITHNIAVTANAPNGGTDMVSSNNSLTKSIQALSATPHKNVLLEEFTTAPCQYCPRGTTVMNGILNSYSDRVIGVALHAGFGTDAMTIPDHSTLASAYTSGAPSACVDRVLFDGEEEVGVSTNVWQSFSLQRAAVTTPVSVIASNTYNPTTRQLSINASARFYGAITDNFRLNCYIVEDSVSGTGSGYNQVNAYNNTPSSEWYQKGNPIIGFKHRHVVRKMLGGAYGTNNSVVSPTADGGIYTFQYNDSLKSTWNESRVTLVVVVHHYASNVNDREIMNALEIHLNSADSTSVSTGTAINEINNSFASVALFPNPATDVVYVNFALNQNTRVALDVYDVLGRLVTSSPASVWEKGEYRTAINTANLNNGVYFAAVKDGNKVVQTLKFIVSK